MRGRGFFWLLVAVLVASLGLMARRWRVETPEAELDRAAAHVRAAFRPGDLIMVQPPWLAGPRQRLGDLALAEPRHLEAADLRGLDRVHLIEVPSIGARHELAARVVGLGTVVDAQQFGGVSVKTVDLLGKDQLVFDLRAQLPAVTVTARYADGVEAPCDRFERDRWSCPRDSVWSYVGVETLDIDGQPRECVWLHPLPAGAELRLRLPRLAAPARGELEAAFGFTADAARRAAAPVAVRLVQGGRELLAATLPVAPGWRRFTARLEPSSEPIELTLTTTNNGAAHLCGAVRIFEVGE